MIPAKKDGDITPASIEAVLIKGDLSKLTEEQRLEYYNSVCKLVGLNPLTRPFDYLFLNSKLVLYPNKSCAEQLRKIHKISLEIVSQDLSADGLYTVHARAKDDTGRTDEDVGVVTFGQLRSGDAIANMILKCVTKAKRRVTLSICGLGFLDSEGDDAPHTTERRQPYRLYPADDKTTVAEPSEQIEPHQLSVPQLPNNSGTDWRAFGEELTKILRACETKAEVFEWLEFNKTLLNEMGSAVPKMFNNLQATIEEIKAEPT